jgi:hypothetical protein
MRPPSPSQAASHQAAAGAVEAMEEKMRVLKTGKLAKCTRAELWLLLRRVSRTAASARKGAVTHRVAAISLRRIRQMLTHSGCSPY